MSSSLSSSHHHDDWHDDDDINDSSGESSDDLAEHSDIKKPNRKNRFQKSKSLKKSSRKLNKSKSASASASEITTTDSGRESVERCKKNDKTDDDGKSNTTDGVVVSKKTNNDAIPADADADNESTDVEEKDEESKSNADDDDVTSKKDEEIKSNTDEGVVTSKKTYDNISADIEGKKNKDEETKSNTDEDVVTSKNTKDDAIPAADVEGKKKKDEENSNNSDTEDNVVMSKKTNDNAIPAVEGKKKKDEENKSNTNDDDVVMSKKTNGDAISAVEGKKKQDEENNSDTDDDDIVMSTKNSNDDAESSKNDNEKMKADNKDNDEKKGPSSATSDEKKTGPGTTTSDSKLSNDAASDLVHFLHSTPIENGSRNKYSSSKSTDTTTTATTATMKENETGASKVNKDEKKGDDDDAEITAENTVDDRSTIATKEEEDHDQEDGRDNMEAIGASRKQRIIYSKRRDDDVHIDPAATATATATTVKEKRKLKPLPSSKKKAAAPAPAPSVAPATAGRGAASTDATKKLTQQVIIETTYRNNVTASNNDLQRSSQFPFRLHNMLDDAERTGHSHIVSWSPGGESFKIHLPKQLINVLQKYFRQSKFKSFLRQLQGYDFKRITRGKDQGVVSHPMFLRGRRSACTLMKRKRVVPRGEQPAQQAKVGQASASTSTIATGAAATGIAAKSAAKDTVARNHRGIPITNRRKRQPLAINHVKNAAPTGAGMMYSGSNSGNSNVQTYSSTQHHQIPQHLGQGQQQPTRYSMHHYPVSTAHHQRHLYLHEGPMKNGMQSQQQLHQQQLHERQQQHPYPNHQNMMTMTPGTYDAAAAAMATTKQIITIINPDPQDVLCVDVPNVEQFQGNKKLSSIAQKITSHFISANESVKAMIVNEISSRIQKGGSRFLKLTEDGRNWMECNEEEINLKVISCFELEAPAPTTIKSDLSVGSIPNSMIGSAVVGLKPDLSIPGNINSDSIVGTSSDTRRRIQYPPSDKDVVLRGGPSSEKEGNTYLITMIQANVGQQVDSFEMKRIKCRAILDRMSKRGSRFFLKLKETDTDDDLYCLSDTEAQDVIFTAFCAEEKKIQSLMASNNAAASVRHNRVGSNAALLESQLGSRMLQGDAALLNSIRSSSNNGMLSSQAATQSAYLANRSLAGGKRPLENSDHLPPDVYEKRLRADTDEQVKMLIEVARQERDGSFGLAGRLPYARQPPIADTPSSNTSTGNASMEKLLKDRDDLLRNQLGYAPSTSIRDLPTNNEINANNNQFVEFLKKKYVGNPKVSW